MTPMMMFSIMLLKFFTEADVKTANQKKSDNYANKNQIVHAPKLTGHFHRVIIKRSTKTIKNVLSAILNRQELLEFSTINLPLVDFVRSFERRYE